MAGEQLMAYRSNCPNCGLTVDIRSDVKGPDGRIYCCSDCGEGVPVNLQHRACIAAIERHFTPQEIAESWVLDESTIRRIFIDEPGVLKLGKANRRDGKRDYVTLRIPQSVLQRVYQRRAGRT
jgi:hypothetical protein